MDCAAIIHDHRTFRTILQAMSHPGKVHLLPEFSGEDTAVIELLRCLIDNETQVAVLGDNRLGEDLALGCGCRLSSVCEADFIVVAPGADTSLLDTCRRGDLLYPDKGATVVFLVDGLSEGDDGILLRGPGINGFIHLRISGLRDGELARLARLNGEFPLGVDAMLLVRRRRGRLACIPRSTRIGGQ